MSEQPPSPRPGSSEPTQPLPPAVGAPSAAAPGAVPGGGQGAPTAPQQPMYAGPPPVTGAGQPPVGPPPHQPGLWQRATATTGRRWGLAIAAAAVVLILFLGLAIGGLLLLGHSGFGHMAADRRLGVSGPPGQGFGPDQEQRNRGQGMPMNPGQMPGLRGMGGLGLLGANGSAHGEVTTTGGNGQSLTLVFQAGDVTAVSSSSVTLKSADGFTQTYPVTSDTRVRGGSISSVQAGEHVLVVAHKDGNTAVLVARTGRGGTTSTQ